MRCYPSSNVVASDARGRAGALCASTGAALGHLTPRGVFTKVVDMEQSVAEVVRAARRSSGMTLRGLARRLSCSPGYLSRIEVRGELPAPDFAIRLAGQIGADPDQFLALIRQEQLGRVQADMEAKHEEAIAMYRKERKPR